MNKITMFSSAEKVKGQGVSAAYQEQVNLVKQDSSGKFTIEINKPFPADISHYHTIDPIFYLTIPFAKKFGKTVGYVHFLPETIEGSLKLPKVLKNAFNKYMISFYKKMDYLVTVNPVFIDKLAEYGIDRSKITYIPNFVSDKEFFPQDKKTIETTRKEWGIHPEAFVVLGVGQVQTRKGVLDFIEIAKLLPDIAFVWAGGFSFGMITDGYEELKKIVDNPPPNVKFLGIIERSDMNSIYNIADVFFLPSYNELFPMAILEAMNCNRPLLLRDLDLYNNILFDFYLKGNSNDEFADLLQRLAEDSSLYKTWQDKSFEGHKFYGRENVLKLWIDFYDNISKEPSEIRASIKELQDYISDHMKNITKIADWIKGKKKLIKKR